MTRRENQTESESNVEADLLARWSAALHESGHVVGARILLNDQTASAILLLNNSGMAYHMRLRPVMPMLSFDEILQCAAGPAAESLAEKHSPPAEAPIHLAEGATSPPEMEAQRAEAAKDGEKTLPDAVRLARWCCEGRLREPEKWAERHRWITYTAAEFVKDHAGAILKVARKLFIEGHVGPADEVSKNE